MFNFEKLAVWQKAITFAGTVYRISRNFPTDERFGLTNQIRRTATSIPSNIAEGSARPPADYSRFIGYAAGSLYEVVTQTTLACNEGFLLPTDFAQLYHDADEISRILAA